MGLPEQVRFRMESEEYDVAHSLRADPDWTQSDLILHTDLWGLLSLFYRNSRATVWLSADSSCCLQGPDRDNSHSLVSSLPDVSPPVFLHSDCLLPPTWQALNRNKRVVSKRIKWVSLEQKWTRSELQLLFYLSRWVQQLCQVSRCFSLSLSFYSPGEQTHFLHTGTLWSTLDPPLLHRSPPWRTEGAPQPSCLQTTSASCWSKSASHTEDHDWLDWLDWLEVSLHLQSAWAQTSPIHQPDRVWRDETTIQWFKLDSEQFQHEFIIRTHLFTAHWQWLTGEV